MLGTIRNHLDTFISGLGLLATLAGWMVDRFLGDRRVVTYRVHLNSKIGVTPRSVASNFDFEIRHRGQPVPDGSLVLLRLKNAGRLDVGREDVSAESPITFTFPGRTVQAVQIFEPSPASLGGVIQPEFAGETVRIPQFELNRGNRFKLLVLLSGDRTEVGAGGYIRGGRVERDSDRRRNRGLVFGGLSLLLAGLLIGLLIVNHTGGTPSAIRCVRGELRIEGSTAFAPVVKSIADEYHHSCGNASVTVVADGSITGLRSVEGAGRANAGDAGTRLAMSDGAASGEFGSLVARPVAVVVFSLVVNQSTGVHDLTVAQVRDIYAGRVTNWKQVGGADLAIRIVSRGSESGTRGAFERRVLGTPEPAVSSNDCISKDRDPQAATIRCEFGTEATLLDEVSRTPGAIGYAERGAAATYQKVNEVKLGGWEADLSTVERGEYPFWEVEYFYTYGNPAGDSLLSAFLEYATLDSAKNLLRADSFTPCVDRAKNLMTTLCAQH
ncbi:MULTISPECIES: substrate-binding domain-containing protein [unclassified Frankia]|uniref:substrate-binding domain-containing protein n=1 Tax=unclassified Frankia TaxID=2632575 RepID=UPI0027DC52C6|nr:MULTISPECIES: substrate-binding domain-containing protein [unclassified Frankia]